MDLLHRSGSYIARGSVEADPALGAVQVLVFAGTMALAALVALAITAHGGGISRTMALFDRVFRWQTGARWYVFAVGYIAAIRLAAAITHRVMTGAWPPLDPQPFGIIIRIDNHLDTISVW